MPTEPPYLLGLKVVRERVRDPDRWPFHLPAIRTLDLVIDRPVTFLVGENGAGKSTVLEALAVLCGLPASGGAKADRGARHGPEDDAPLADALRPSFRKRPRDGYFFRAEFQAHFASLLEQRRDDPDFHGDPFALYGGRSLHARSHGEAYLEVFRNRMRDGLYLMDEPESALSPQRQLTLLAQIRCLVDDGGAQFVIATHAPILLTYPGARILSFDGDRVEPIRMEETSHVQITRDILAHPERYWSRLTAALEE